ncbi:MAG: nucleotidyltransferase domain-containing protein [Clostridiales bacterium]|nr:nucleotidyltransferase domain-containing protein [Clostridiales bacterium]
MFDVQSYLARLTALLREAYGERLVYVGLQGSYLRGEATEESDIDVMAVVDDLSQSDLDAYRRAIYSLEEPEKSCGFIASRADLMHWNPLEIAHLAHTTRDYYGTLSALLPAYTESDVRNFVRVSVGNLYHELCHRYIHSGRERSAERLPGVYKGVFYILQNLYFLQSGEFALTRAALLARLSGQDHAVLERAMALHRGEEFDFDESFNRLFTWCQETLASL